jgi:hypothetical protein
MITDGTEIDGTLIAVIDQDDLKVRWE